jgi:hypothetical protein
MNKISPQHTAMRRFAMIAASAIASLVVGGVMAFPRTTTQIPAENVRKADYIFLESQRLKQQNKADAYYEAVARAYELNPEDKYLGMEYGVSRMMLSDGDSIELEQGLKLVGDYAYSAPEDLYNSAKYASLADNLGHRSEALKIWKLLYERNHDRPEVALKYADLLTASFDTASMDKALEIYTAIEQSEGKMPLLTSRKLTLYNVRRDTAAMISEMKDLLASSPRSSEYNSMMGMMMMELGRKDSALKYLDKAVELDPSSGAAYYQKARYYKAIGDSVGYDREVFKAMLQPDLDLEPKMDILRQYVGDLYEDSTQKARIVNLFQSLIDQYPHEASVRQLYSDYLALSDMPADAAEQLSYAVDIDPANERSWLMLCSLYMQAEEWNKVVSSAQRGVRYFPESTGLYGIMAVGYTQLKDYDNSVAQIRKALEVADSTDVKMISDLYTTLGDTYYAWEKNDSAYRYYMIALEYNPDNLGAMNNCAYYMACENKDLDKAEAMIKRVVSEKPEDATSLDTYAWVLFKKRDMKQAKELIDGALENTPAEDINAEILEHAGDIYFMNLEREQALEFWKQALELDPDNELLRRKVKYKSYYDK